MLMFRSGKTTLLRHIASRDLGFSSSLDVLLCEQEVVANKSSAVEVILKSDTQRCDLLHKADILEDCQLKGEMMVIIIFLFWQ